MLQIKTPYGAQEIAENSLIAFPNGLPGLDGCVQFKLFHSENNQTSGIYWLQSFEQPDVMLTVAVPHAVNIDYHFQLNDEEMKLLNAKDSSNLLVLLPLYKTSADMQENNLSPSIVNAAFKAPLVINLDAQIGLQKTLYQTEITALVTEIAD